jgi:hypothetical protein
MSTNLYWKPNYPETYPTLGKGLKWAIEREYGCSQTLNRDDMPFLRGVRAGQDVDSEMARNCNVLLDAIEKYGSVVVWIAE